ncbi:hypothetical protein SLE2022_105820 [Rubroshorea leprosula]
MASINFNPFGSWFEKPLNPVAPVAMSLSQTFFSKLNTTSANFASISSSSSLSKGKPEKPDSTIDNPGPDRKMLDQFFWECENLPDYRHTPEVEKILNEDPVFEKKENPTEEEIKENEKWWERFRTSPVVQFLARAEEIADEINRTGLEENAAPYRGEDRELWEAIPHLTGLDGRPMPRKAIKTRVESDNKFWDFLRQFLFGLWGFRQRPYPAGRPIDFPQAFGYKRLERRYYDFIMKSGGFYYKDRLGRTRGPCELITLKTAWGAGIIDKDTFIWGEDMDEWAPIHMVYGMERAIATWEVRLGAAATALLHKLQKGIPPWVPLKGHEKKTYKQLQREAIESKRRDLAVLRANDGMWPGARIPSHALFLWASGSELTTTLQSDHMPNKFIPKDLRLKLAKIIPELRPWEVLSVEQAMNQITYGGEWYREPLGSYTTGPPYIWEMNEDNLEKYEDHVELGGAVYEELEKTIPGFSKIMEKVEAEAEAKFARLEERKEKLRRIKGLGGTANDP